MGELEKLSEDEIHILHHVAGRQLALTKGDKDMQNISSDVINGFRPTIERGNLGLVKAEAEAEAEDKDGGKTMASDSLNGQEPAKVQVA